MRSRSMPRAAASERVVGDRPHGAAERRVPQQQVDRRHRGNDGSGGHHLLVVDAQPEDELRPGQRQLVAASAVAEDEAHDVLEHEGYAHGSHEQRDCAALAQRTEHRLINPDRDDGEDSGADRGGNEDG